MRLASFQITNFRSINDSGLIDSTQITAILGRNDSGKSNLLRALHSLNPAEGLAELSLQRAKEGQADVAAARAISTKVEQEFVDWGVKETVAKATVAKAGA